MNSCTVKRSTALAEILYYLLLLFVNNNAMFVSITIQEGDETFQSNKPINFIYLGDLGEGDFGNVYLVEQGLPSVQYAVKKAKEGEELFLRNEWEASFRIPIKERGGGRIIKIHGIGKASGDLIQGDVLLMEYVDYPNLYKMEFEHITTAMETILTVGIGLVDCMDLMWEGRVYHMDIKPENILFDKTTGKVVLLDLGFAWFYGSKVWEGTKLNGTLPYMCPCLIDQKPNHKCDVRSMLFVLAVSKYNGEFPWLQLCNDFAFKNQRHLFPDICSAKMNFENGLETEDPLGNVLKRIFVHIRDKELIPGTKNVDYPAIREVFTTALENLNNNETVNDAANSKIKGKCQEGNKGKNGKEDKKKERFDKGLFADEEIQEKGKKQKSFSKLTGIKLKVPSFLKKFVRQHWRRSTLTTTKPI